MRYADVTRQILARFPELQLAYERLVDVEGEPGQYIVFEDLLGVYVELLMTRHGERDQEKLAEVFRLLETLLASKDEEVQNLVKLGMLYGKSAAWLKLAAGYLGPEAKRYLEEHRIGWDAEIADDASALRETVDPYCVAEALHY